MREAKAGRNKLRKIRDLMWFGFTGLSPPFG
jgi:hypothetical protein